MRIDTLKRPVEITQKMVAAAQALLMAMAYEEAVRPIVEGYRTRILQKHKFLVAPEFAEGKAPEVILDGRRAYLMSDADFAIYDAECKKARIAAGLQVEKPEFCPLCVAEGDLGLAGTNLLLVMAEHPRLGDLANLATARADLRKQAIDVTLRLLAPYVGTSDEVIKQALAA